MVTFYHWTVAIPCYKIVVTAIVLLNANTRDSDYKTYYCTTFKVLL